ncbi:uncharacterized protein FRV6_14335 [Fusarium oxysporum]|uniref:F-box domain-containing protein n=1 Tax=Fusarium oxysporum TaxID=5507 RepID=A0A2H3TNQ7_FUSOX|nr:uncharacterized protein FRV6_14335 [Fusarium oxysporum]
MSEYRCLSLDHGDVNKAQKDRWECIPGQEYTFFSPQCQAQLKDDIVAYISSPEFDKPQQYRHEVKRESNPLTALPETVIFGISEFLDSKSLVNLFYVDTRYLRDMDDDGSIWPEQRRDTFDIDGPGGEMIEEVIVHHALFRDPSPKAIKICINRGRSVIWGVDMERGEHGEETDKPCPSIMSHRLPTHLRPDNGFAIVGFVMGCGKVFGRWHSDEYHVEQSEDPDCDSHSRRLDYWGEDYIDEEDSRGPWTKDQYDRRN